MLTSLELILKKPELVKKIFSFPSEGSRRKDLEASRCISKFWNEAISDAISCFNRERTRFLLLHPGGNQILNFGELKKDPEELNPNRHHYAVSGFPGALFTNPCLYSLGSCNGLVCFLESRKTVVLWNPKTGKSRIFKQQTPIFHARMPTFYGFGYDHTTQRYKIVVGGLVDYKLDPYLTRVEIFQLETESWRIAQDTGYSDRDMGCQYSSFYFRGALYWLGENGENNDAFLEVVRFDLAKEKFEKVYKLIHKDTSEIESPAFYVGATERYPCYITMNLFTRKITIWQIDGIGRRSEFTTIDINKLRFMARTWKNSMICVKDLDFNAQTCSSIHIFDDRYVLLHTSVGRKLDEYGDWDDDMCENNVLIVYDIVDQEIVSMHYGLMDFLTYKETSEPIPLSGPKVDEDFGFPSACTSTCTWS